MTPFTPDGKLSISALRQLGRLAESARRHIGDGNFYTTPGGGVVLGASETTQLSHQTVAVSGVSLSSSWANVNLSVTLPANTLWLLLAQITASISASSTGAGDDLSFRYYDGTNQYGETVTCCTAPCNSFTSTEAAPLNAVVTVGSIALTVNIQGIINTSTGSTAQMTDGSLIAQQLG